MIITQKSSQQTGLAQLFKPANLKKAVLGFLAVNSAGAMGTRDIQSVLTPAPSPDCAAVFNGSHLLRGFQAPDTRGTISAVPQRIFDTGNPQATASLNNYLDSLFNVYADTCGIECAPVAGQNANKTIATQTGTIDAATGEAFNATVTVQDIESETARCIDPPPSPDCTTHPC